MQIFAPELEKRSRSYLKPTNDSWRVDETYIKVRNAPPHSNPDPPRMHSRRNAGCIPHRRQPPVGSAVKGDWKYLYRAVDSKGNTLDFMLSATRDAKGAARFLRKVLKAQHNQHPRVINVDKNAAYPLATEKLKQEKVLEKETKLRQVKYLNNLIEQDHRFIKKLVKSGLGFQSFYTAWRTIRGYEIMNAIRKGQINNIRKGDILGQNNFIKSLFGIAV